MKLSRGSALLVDQIKQEGHTWRDIAPTPMHTILRRYNRPRTVPIERVHVMKYGDYLVSELTEGRSKYAKGGKR